MEIGQLIEKQRAELKQQVEAMHQAQAKAMRQAQTGEAGMNADSNFCSASKPWVECSIEEKIERLREQVKAAQSINRELSALREQLWQLQARFGQHVHQMDDRQRVVLPLGSEPKSMVWHGECDQQQQTDVDPAKVYF